MTNVRLATDAQLARLQELKNRLPYEEIQTLIRRYSHSKGAKPSDRHFHYWEYHFARHGDLFMRILQPFYEWDRKIAPPLPELDGRLYEAFVRRFAIRGVHPVARSYAQEAEHGIGTEIRLATELRTAYWPLLLDDRPVRDLFNPLRLAIRDQFHAQWKEAGIIRAEAVLHELLHITCFAPLVNAPVISSEVAPLLDLWLAGNIPLGLDRENRLLVIVSD